MSDNIIYQEFFDNHQLFFESYIKQLTPKNENNFAILRLSYINYLTDVKYINNNIQYFYIIVS